MSDKTSIEWTSTRNPDGTVSKGATWNPMRGCSLVSDGCKNCYAMGVAGRFNGPGQPYEGLTTKTTQGAKWTGQIMLVPAVLAQPLKWTRPRKIFVNSMSDFFHEGVPESYIDQVFAIMALAAQHTFQILTKRPERMREYCRSFSWDRVIKSCTGTDGVSTIERHTLQALRHHFGLSPQSPLRRLKDRSAYPLPNVQMGTSVEDQPSANARIALLLDTPAAIRWVSIEPLLGPVRLNGLPGLTTDDEDIRIDALGGSYRMSPRDDVGSPCNRIDWVVVGGESGPKARPMHPDWARSLRDQCTKAGIPFLFKQWGAWAPGEPVPGKSFGDEMRKGTVQLLHAKGNPEGFFRKGDAFIRRVGKKDAGRLLDGSLHDGYPMTAAVQK